MKKKTYCSKKSIDSNYKTCNNKQCNNIDRCERDLRYVSYDEGVQENALVQFPKVAEEGSFVLEPQVLPYRNADKCRLVMKKVYLEHLKKIENKVNGD